MEKFNLRLGKLEVRSCDDMLLDKTPHTKAEIVNWYKEDGCITIAVFENKKDEGWDVRLLGSRVLEEDFNVIGKLTKFALSELFALSEDSVQ